jgi:hypothetical protein
VTGQRFYYNVFGMTMGIERKSGHWLLFRISEEGKSSRVTDVGIPAELTENELATFLDDLYHEYARPGSDTVIRLR